MSSSSNTKFLRAVLLALALLVVAASARSTPAPAPAPASSPTAAAAPAAAAVASPAPAPAKAAADKNANKKSGGEVHEVVWGFPHAPRPHLIVAPGDTVTFTWDQLHGVYALGRVGDSKSVAGGKKSDKNAKEVTCKDFKGFHDTKKILAGMPRREGYYGPNHGSVSWLAPDKEGAYAFADNVDDNCMAGMLLVVDVEKVPKGNGKAAAVTVAPPSPAPAPAKAAAESSVSVASSAVSPSDAVAPEPVSPGIQEATNVFVEEAPAADDPLAALRERHEAHVAEREAAREERRTQRAIEEGRVDFEGSELQHVIED